MKPLQIGIKSHRFILHMTDEDVDDRRAETQTRSEYQEKVLCPFDGNEASSFDIWAKRSHYVRLMSQTDFLVPTCEGPMTVLTESWIRLLVMKIRKYIVFEWFDKFNKTFISQISHARWNQALTGPFTISLVLERSAITSSEKPRCCLTNVGGVRASHCTLSQYTEQRVDHHIRTWFKLISSNISVNTS